MARTKKRALVSGLVTGKSALVYGAVLGLLGFFILGRYTNALTVYLGLGAIFTYLVLYGISKRRSVHGTLVGSIAGALPPVAGYVSVKNNLDSGAVIIFLIYVLWQMPHFYAIAIYRLKDYKAAGLPVLPVVKGIAAAKLQIVIYTFAFVMASLSLTAFGYTGVFYLAVMSLVGLMWLIKGLRGFTAENNDLWARKMFLFSLIVVLVQAVMLAIGPIFPI